MAHRRAKSSRDIRNRRRKRHAFVRAVIRLRKELQKRTINALKREYREQKWKIRTTYLYYRNSTITDIIRDWWSDRRSELIDTYNAFREMDLKTYIKTILKLMIHGHSVRFDYRREFTREEVELYLMHLDKWLQHMEFIKRMSETAYLGIKPDIPDFGAVLSLAELYYAPLRHDECHSTASAIKVTDLSIKILTGHKGTAYVIISGAFEHIGWSPYLRRADVNHGIEPFFIVLMAKKRKGERLSLKIGSGAGVIGKDMKVVLCSNNLRIPEEELTIKQILDNPNELLRLRAESIGRPESATKLRPCSVYVVLRPTEYGRDRRKTPHEVLALKWWERTDKTYTRAVV